MFIIIIPGDVYGDEITVVRHINGNSGASTYKLKNHLGKVVSTTRQDLVKMCLCLNIQVDNPVLILNQDAARSFLKECDPKKLYQLFMKATQIETIIEKLNSCFKTAVSSKNQLESLNKSIEYYELDIQAIREKHTRLQSVKSLRKKIENNKNEVAWLQVITAEKELHIIREDLSKKQVKVKRITDFINNKEKYEKETKERIRELGTNFKTLENQVNENTKLYENARKDFETERDKLSEFENNFKSIADKLNKKVIPNIAQLEQSIEEYENNPANVDNLRKENEAKIADIDRKRSDLTAVLENCKRDHQMFLRSLTDHRENQNDMKAVLRREQDKVIKMEQQISQYKNAGKDKLSVYGSTMSQLLAELEQMYKQKKFSEMPRGPLGKYIEVPMQKYRMAVESILGNILTSFIVNNDHDRLLLTEVFKKYREFSRTQIITTEFVHQVYDISNGIVQLETEGDILINVIKVSDAVVMNCLIDQKKIETVVLVEDTDHAIALTQDEQNVPYNLLRVVLLNPFSEFHPAPKYRSYSMREQPARYIQTNFKDLIDATIRQKQTQEQRCVDIQRQMKELIGKVTDFEKHVNEKKKMMTEFQRKDGNYVRELDELKSLEFAENTDIDFLRSQLEEEKRLKITFEKKIEQLKMKLGVLKEIVADRKSKVDRYIENNRNSRNEMLTARSQIETEQRGLETMKNEIETKGRQIAALRNEETTLGNNVKQYDARIKEMTSKIKGKRVETHNTEENLKNSIRSCEKRITTIESSNENIEEIELLMNNKMAQVENMKNIHKALDNVLKRVSKFILKLLI